MRRAGSSGGSGRAGLAGLCRGVPGGVDLDDLVATPAHRLRELDVEPLPGLGARLTARHMPLTARAEFTVLASLEEYGPLSQADIGRRLGLDRNEVSSTVARLADEGHVDRRPNPTDRRRNVVTLTAAGSRRLAEIQAYADAAQAEPLAGLNAGERSALAALLAKLLDSHGLQGAQGQNSTARGPAVWPAGAPGPPGRRTRHH